MSDLLPTERFSNRACDYARFRPGYPPDAYEFLQQTFHLNANSSVADIGSGTGLSSAPLLDLGCRVFAVEPNALMRSAAESALQGRPGFHSLPGSAEETGLNASSIDLILAAQAFHWFDVPKARAEFQRILKSGGSVALLWNERLETETPFLAAYEALLHRFGTDYAQVRRQTAVHGGALDAFFGPNGYEVESFSNRQDLDFEGLKGRLLSCSYIPQADDPRSTPMLTELSQIFTKLSENGKVAMLYEAKIYYGRISE